MGHRLGPAELRGFYTGTVLAKATGMSRIVLAALIFASLFVSATGCALTGRTRPQEVARPAGLAAPLRVADVALEPGQTRLQNVGTFAWGEYDARDVGVLRESLDTTVGGAADGPSVHVVVRRFLVAHSNNEALAVACVAWALTDASGQLLFHEQFYAADYVRIWGTVGGIKNHVHAGITEHVANQAARISNGQEPVAPSGEYVFDSYEAATAGMPDSLTSTHFQTLYLGGAYLFSAYSIKGRSDRGWARRNDHLDWDARLAKGT